MFWAPWRGHSIGHIDLIYKFPRSGACAGRLELSQVSPHLIRRDKTWLVNAMRVRAGSCHTPQSFGRPGPPVGVTVWNPERAGQPLSTDHSLDIKDLYLLGP